MSMQKKTVLERRTSHFSSDQLPLDLHPVLRRIYLARGVNTAIELELPLAQLAPPTLSNLQHAAELLAEAILQQQHIIIVGDFDADGATGTAVAIKGLRLLGAHNVSYCVPNRFNFGYGLTPPLVDAIVDPNNYQRPDLIITVDNGISSISGVAHANSLGIPTIITDHHLPAEQLPDAAAIVNPNLPGDDFPSKSLAGVGVMFYLLSGIRKALVQSKAFENKKPPNLAILLDLVALGTVADMVPLDVNNRILVQQGLRRIRAGKASAGIAALMMVSGINQRQCNAMDLSWKLAPRLNAAGRLEDMSIGIECLLTDDQNQADELAAILHGINEERRSVQAQMQADADIKIEALIDNLQHSTLSNKLPNGICLFDKNWHQGVVGLVAGRVKEALQRPVIALAPANQQGIELKGSARSVNGIHIRDMLALLDANHPGLILKFGGHAMAAGLSLETNNLEAFKAAWETTLATQSLPKPTIYSDGELSNNDLQLSLAKQLEQAGPWGQAFPEPLFDGKFVVIERRLVGSKHVKLQLSMSSENQGIDAIAFFQDIETYPLNAKLHLAYKLQVNRFRGRESVQLLIEKIL